MALKINGLHWNGSKPISKTSEVCAFLQKQNHRLMSQIFLPGNPEDIQITGLSAGNAVSLPKEVQLTEILIFRRQPFCAPITASCISASCREDGSV